MQNQRKMVMSAKSGALTLLFGIPSVRLTFESAKSKWPTVWLLATRPIISTSSSHTEIWRLNIWYKQGNMLSLLYTSQLLIWYLWFHFFSKKKENHNSENLKTNLRKCITNWDKKFSKWLLNWMLQSTVEWMEKYKTNH